MEKTHYLICFDVFDDKRRRRLVRHLEQFSYRIQYSVFCVDADKSRLEKIRRGIEQATSEDDSVFIFPMNSLDWKNKIIYGEKNKDIKKCDEKVIVI